MESESSPSASPTPLAYQLAALSPENRALLEQKPRQQNIRNTRSRTIPHTGQEASETFRDVQLDALVIGDFLVVSRSTTRTIGNPPRETGYERQSENA